MAITQAMTTSAKLDFLSGAQTIGSDTIKMALFTSAATLDATTAAYAATNEVVGAGYTAGGETMASVALTSSGTTAFADWADVVWAASTITARGALIYNSTKANKSIAVIDFGADKISTAGDFTVVCPVAAAATALVRIA